MILLKCRNSKPHNYLSLNLILYSMALVHCMLGYDFLNASSTYHTDMIYVNGKFEVLVKRKFFYVEKKKYNNGSLKIYTFTWINQK